MTIRLQLLCQVTHSCAIIKTSLNMVYWPPPRSIETGFVEKKENIIYSCFIVHFVNNIFLKSDNKPMVKSRPPAYHKVWSHYRRHHVRNSWPRSRRYIPHRFRLSTSPPRNYSPPRTSAWIGRPSEMLASISTGSFPTSTGVFLPQNEGAMLHSTLLSEAEWPTSVYWCKLRQSHQSTLLCRPMTW